MYQCILTTDGNRSFALLRYADMLWGPGQRQQHNALVGYTDGNYTHEEPTIPADNLFGPGGRYRPNQWLGPLGKPGQLVYDLSKPSGAKDDPRIKCQGWALKQPDPNEWATGLPSCPCTRTQALEDMSFIQEVLDQANNIAALRAQRYGGIVGHVFRSVLSNSQGSGKRCVYELEGALLTGYSERYFTEQSTQKHVGKC